MLKTTQRLRGIILTLTERCNLRCDYCYVPVEHGRRMPQAIADRAVDWFVSNAADNGTLDLSFFGGEPFLASQQMRQAESRVRGLVADDRRVRVTTPTNALAMSDDDVAWCRQHDVELAISIDGGPDSPGRRLVDGSSSARVLARAVPGLLRKLPPGSALARMTVTPTNAGSLCASVRALSRLGFERIVYLPNYDATWDQISLSLWRREHQRLATWMIGARSAAKPVPELPAWKAIATRLQRRVPRRRCGAGIEQITVTPDGGLYPCYRFAYAKGAEVWRLGDVRDGVVHAEKLALLEGADVDRLRPEGRSCASCAAADGCTHHCPAVGFLSSGDVHHVPEAVCQLMEAQVASVRELCAASFYAPRTKPAAHPWAKAAAVAAALTGLAACESSSTQAKPDASDANQTRDAGIGDDLRDGQSDRAPQILLDAAGPDDGQAIDADQVDSQNSYLPIGGTCW